MWADHFERHHVGLESGQLSSYRQQSNESGALSQELTSRNTRKEGW